MSGSGDDTAELCVRKPIDIYVRRNVGSAKLIQVLELYEPQISGFYNITQSSACLLGEVSSGSSDGKEM